ncbi:hypothetical protein TNCV_174631 [Trichonephila clavipes]|nr:hypothetical protein TNCV_174631 [Trichonephila clavipes]
MIFPIWGKDSYVINVGKTTANDSNPSKTCAISLQKVSAADKGCRVYPLDPRHDAVALYSGCTPDERRAWCLPDDRHTAFLVRLRGAWRQARMKMFFRAYESKSAVPG